MQLIANTVDFSQEVTEDCQLRSHSVSGKMQKKLKQLCRTRWVERIASYQNFWNLLVEVFIFLLESNISFYLLGDHKVKSNII